jgi:heme oxygenase (mycobilin-producing)
MALIRIVRMEFRKEELNTFENIFSESRDKIAAFPGCSGVALLTDPENETVRYTYSIWDSGHSLNLYRDSELFAGTWAKTKPLFSGKPQAFSLIKNGETALPKV